MPTYNESGSGGGVLNGLSPNYKLSSEVGGGGVVLSFRLGVYNYTISTDTLNGVVASDALTQEIADSSIIVSLYTIDVLGDSLDVWMKAQLSAGEKTTLDALVAAHDGIPITSDEPEEVNIANAPNVSINNASFTPTDKFIRTTVEPREGDAKNFYSPNMCDRTTWYEGGTEVTEFTLTDSGDQTTYNTNGTHPGPWVDLYHGKLFNEDLILLEQPGHAILVEVQTGGSGDFVEQTQNTFDASDGDYSVDYTSGTITFNSALGGSDVVRASFCKAPSTMTWTMAPSAGKRLKLMYAEFQMTSDVEMDDDIWYQTWAYNPFDLPNKIKVFEYRYKTLSDLLYESTGVYPRVTGFGGTGPRGLGNKDMIIFPFHYNTARDILSSQGVEIRIVTGTEHTGTIATTTLYCLEEDE